ncbi:hypothetical protein ABT294_18405 [Nonomuraea sp. NPDC000554]
MAIEDLDHHGAAAVAHLPATIRREIAAAALERQALEEGAAAHRR